MRNIIIEMILLDYHIYSGKKCTHHYVCNILGSRIFHLNCTYISVIYNTMGQLHKNAILLMPH